MIARSVWVAVAVAGCGYHQVVGRPPSSAEIAQINDRAAGDPAGMRLYLAEPVRPIPDTAAPSIRRIVTADEHRLTVAGISGEVWSTEMSRAVGVTIRAPRPGRAAVAGGAVGLGLGAAVALCELLLSGPGPDAQVTASPGPHPVPVGLAVGTLIGLTLAGGVAGVLIDRHSPTLDSFDFGGGHGFTGFLPHR